MKDYFSVSYTYFLQSKTKNISNITPLLKMKDFEKLNENYSNDYFYALKNIQGINAGFCFFNNSYLSSIENDDDELLKKIEEKYDIQNNLFSYYTELIIQGKIYRNELYVYSIIKLNSDFSVGMYELKNIVSILGLSTPEILLTKIRLNDIINIEQKGLILTQLNGIDYQERKFFII